MYSFFNVLQRDLLIYLRNKSEFFTPIGFFILTVSLFPIAVGALPTNTLWLVPCIIWIAVLLAVLLAQETLFRLDYQIGIFEQMLMSDASLPWLVLAKIFANWLVTGLPLILITPLLGLSFGLSNVAIKNLVISLCLGTPILSLVGMLGVALTISLPRGGLLLAVLILPLYVPVLVLGTVVGANDGHLALLGAIGIMTVLLVPLAISHIIRMSIG